MTDAWDEVGTGDHVEFTQTTKVVGTVIGISRVEGNTRNKNLFIDVEGSGSLARAHVVTSFDPVDSSLKILRKKIPDAPPTGSIFRFGNEVFKNTAVGLRPFTHLGGEGYYTWQGVVGLPAVQGQELVYLRKGWDEWVTNG